MESNHKRQLIFSIILRKIATVRNKGLLWALNEKLIPNFIWFCLHLILLLLRPLKSIKVILLRTDRIGHLAYNTDILFKKILSEETKWKEGLCIFIAGPQISNQQLWNMYQRKLLSIYNSSFILINNKQICKLFDVLKHMESTSLFENCHLLFDFDYPYYRFGNPKPILSFTPAEEQKGKVILRNMGIDDDSWLVCFHARSSIYEYSLPSETTGFQLGHTFRNADVKTYLEAAEYIAACGGFALRMGSIVAERLPNLNESRIIDYSCNYRSDFGDIYLSAETKFFLGSATGLFAVATIFGVPVAIANFVPLNVLTGFREGDLFITKKIWSHEKGRFLTFGEILDLDSNQYASGKTEEIKLIDNTAKEIRDLAQEMNERLDGTFEITEEDEELQKAFHSIIKPHHYCYGTPVRIGTKFLRDNKDLLA